MPFLLKLLSVDKRILVGLAILALAGLQQLTLNHRANKIESLETQIINIKSSHAALIQSMIKRNELAQAESERLQVMEANALALQKELQLTKSSNNKKIRELLNSEVPATSDASIDLLRQSIDGLTY